MMIIRRKELKTALFIITIFLVSALTFSMPSSVAAKNRDVTSVMKRKSGIKSICKHVNMYVQETQEWKRSSKKKTIKMTKNNKGLIVCTSLMGLQGNAINYHDMRVIDGGPHHAIRPNVFVSTYLKLFGSKPDISKLHFSAPFSVAKINGKYYVPSFDHSENAFPTYRIKKVVQTGKKTFMITINNQRGNVDDESRRTIGKTLIKIKKSKKSSYGYVVVGVTYKVTGNLY